MSDVHTGRTIEELYKAINTLRVLEARLSAATRMIGYQEGDMFFDDMQVIINFVENNPDATWFHTDAVRRLRRVLDSRKD